MLIDENKKIFTSNYQTEWEIAQKFSFPSTIRSLFEYCFSWFIFLLNNYFLFKLLEMHTYFTIPFILLQSLILVRIFILQHDCGHNALFKQSYLNNFAGIICSTVSSITFHFWKDSHAIHHKING
jgi:acyl-lipid omega-6 desaturase (Delta-12 desaturase)